MVERGDCFISSIEYGTWLKLVAHALHGWDSWKTSGEAEGFPKGLPGGYRQGELAEVRRNGTEWYEETENKGLAAVNPRSDNADFLVDELRV
jgi:hypothetical protein